MRVHARERKKIFVFLFLGEKGRSALPGSTNRRDRRPLDGPSNLRTQHLHNTIYIRT